MSVINEFRQTFSNRLFLDFINAGIELFSHTVSFILYFISINPEVQERIFEETMDMNEDLTQEELSRAFYTRAAIHETFRLSPSAFAIARILEEDFELSGYHLKPGVSFFKTNKVKIWTKPFASTDGRVMSKHGSLC